MHTHTHTTHALRTVHTVHTHTEYLILRLHAYSLLLILWFRYTGLFWGLALGLLNFLPLFFYCCPLLLSVLFGGLELRSVDRECLFNF